MFTKSCCVRNDQVTFELFIAESIERIRQTDCVTVTFLIHTIHVSKVLWFGPNKPKKNNCNIVFLRAY